MHALVIAPDKSLTRYLADACQPDGWRLARAHTGLDALVYAEETGRSLDAILLATRHPDMDPVQIVGRLRETESAHQAPLLVVSARGEDGHIRSALARADRVAGVLEVPLSPSELVDALAGLQRRRRIMVLDPRKQRGEAIQAQLSDRGFVSDWATSMPEAATQPRQHAPNLFLVSLEMKDVLQLCSKIKQGVRPPKVLLYGELAKAPRSLEISERRLRADDFLPESALDHALVDRATALVGLGADQPKNKSPRLVEELKSDTSSLRAITARPTTSEALHITTAVKRDPIRVPLDSMGVLKTAGQTVPVQCVELSVEGLSVLAKGPFQLGQKAQIETALPGFGTASRNLSASGKVAWLHQGPAMSLGIVFEDLDACQRKDIEAYVLGMSRILFTPES